VVTGGGGMVACGRGMVARGGSTYSIRVQTDLAAAFDVLTVHLLPEHRNLGWTELRDGSLRIDQQIIVPTKVTPFHLPLGCIRNVVSCASSPY
jgi:hypothetical protein